MNKWMPSLITFVINVSFCFSSQEAPSVHDLFRAALCGQLDEVQRCVTLAPKLIHKCQLGPNSWKENALYVAARFGRLDVVRFLLACGALIEIRCHAGSTALHEAAEAGHLHIVKVLIQEYGARINRKNRRHRTPLHLAAANVRRDIVEWLLDHGAEHTKDMDMQTPLSLAAHACLSFYSAGDVRDVVQLLHSKGADIASRDQNEETPLHRAAWAGNVDVASFLLSNGVSVDATNKWDITPLYLALDKGAFPVVRFLVENGASIDSRCKGSGATPLHAAFRGGSADCVMFLMNCGADVQASAEGYTPLLTALRCYVKSDILKLILEFGVSIDLLEEISWLQYVQKQPDKSHRLDVRTVIQERRREIEEVLLGMPSRLPAQIQEGLRWFAQCDKLPQFLAGPIQWSLARSGKLPGIRDLPEELIYLIIDFTVTPDVPALEEADTGASEH